MKFLITYELGKDECSLYMSGHRLTREELEQLKSTIDKVLKEWKRPN